MAFDSAPAALDAQREVWRKLGPAGRVRLAIEMSEDVRLVTLAGLRKRRPALSSDELLRELVLVLYGFEGTDPSESS